MIEEKLAVPLSDEQTITAIQTLPDTSPIGWLFVYAPGAGSNVHDPFGTYACRRMADRGITSVRFQFPYMEARKRRPDPAPLLEATWRSVVERFRSPGARVAVGGRSMGGRIASQVIAKGMAADALFLFAYPLHPPAQPSRSRDGHLSAVPVPTLFCSGTRDAFATPDELRLAASKVPQAKVHFLEGADHGFATLKSSNRTRQEVWSEAVAVFVDWLRSSQATGGGPL